MPEQIQQQEQEKKQLVGYLKMIALKLAGILNKLERHLDKSLGKEEEQDEV